MTTKPTLRELIDACRADHHDPQRPELSELAPLARELSANPQLQSVVEQSERFDRGVRAALDDVELPAGLADRLLAGCEAALVSPASSEEKSVDAPATKKRWSRRQVIAMFAAAASLLIVLVGGWQFLIWTKPRPVSNDVLAQSAMQWFDQSGPASNWSTGSAPTKDFPLDPAMVYGPVRWRQVNPSTVVYEMRHQGQRALLFVSKQTRPHPGLATSPFTGLNASGGIELGAWQRQKMVYVLAVSGGHGPRPLEVFVRRPKFT